MPTSFHYSKEYLNQVAHIYAYLSTPVMFTCVQPFYFFELRHKDFIEIHTGFLKATTY